MFNEKLLIMLTCDCPAPASLPDIPCVQCPERFGQIQKVAFQRLRDDNGSPNSFPKSGGVDSITDLASWQAKTTAADSTKIVISPYIYSPTQESGAPRTFGGGNDSLNGVEEILGRDVSAFTASLRNCPQTVVELVKKMQCEGALGVYLFDQYGNIECLVDADGNAYPIPIKSFFVGDKVHGGIGAPDTNVIQWAFVPNYSDDLKIFVPTFNPLSDLCVGGSPAQQKAYMNYSFKSIVPSTAKRISFIKRAGGAIFSGYEKIGYADTNEDISVWRDTNYNDWYIVASDKIIVAPQNCLYLFRNYSCTTITFENFDISEVEYIDEMFFNCNSLTTIYSSSDWDLSSLFSSNMFYGCTSLVGGNGTHYNSSHTNGEYARIDRAGTPGYFTAIPS